MAQYKNIEQYRRKKRLSGFAKKMIIIFIILGIMAVLVNILELFQNSSVFGFLSETRDETETASRFPITYKSEQMLDLEPFGAHISVLTKSSVLVYNNSAKKIYSFAHGYTNPVFRVTDKRILTYDRGGYNIRLDSGSDMLNEIHTVGTILTAQIAENGNIAVVSTHERYACELTVYSSNLKSEIYKYYGTEEISAVDFSPDSKLIAATAITLSDGLISSKAYVIDTKSEAAAEEHFIKDTLPLDISFDEQSRIKLVGQHALHTIDVAETGSDKAYTYSGALQQFGALDNDETVIVTQNFNDKNSTVTLIDKKGAAVGSIKTDDEFLDLYCGGETMAILTKSSVTTYNTELKPRGTVDLPTSMSKVTINGGSAFVLGGDTINKYSVSV